MPIRIRETPITRITVPVTRGGNSLISRPIRPETTTPNTPAAITEP
jgi:hypothetical protein